MFQLIKEEGDLNCKLLSLSICLSFIGLLDIDWLVQTSSVQPFQPITSIYKIGNFVHFNTVFFMKIKFYIDSVRNFIYSVLN